MPADLRHQAMIAQRYLAHLELSLRAAARSGDGEDARDAALWAERAHEMKRFIGERV
jgi:hypothetical protein